MPIHQSSYLGNINIWNDDIVISFPSQRASFARDDEQRTLPQRCHAALLHDYSQRRWIFPGNICKKRTKQYRINMVNHTNPSAATSNPKPPFPAKIPECLPEYLFKSTSTAAFPFSEPLESIRMTRRSLRSLSPPPLLLSNSPSSLYSSESTFGALLRLSLLFFFCFLAFPFSRLLRRFFLSSPSVLLDDDRLDAE